LRDDSDGEPEHLTWEPPVVYDQDRDDPPATVFDYAVLWLVVAAVILVAVVLLS
jgi:hypothetical protein